MPVIVDTVDPYLEPLLQWLGVLAIAVIALVINAGQRVGIRRLTRRAVRRALAGRGRWRVRLPRTEDSDLTEQRRLQRADAAAHMFARVTSMVVAAIAVFAASALLEINPLVVLSSAGFVGAGIAIGGQSVIKDWLTGLVALLEDRYAVGDRITAGSSSDGVTGTIEALNGVGLRLRLDDGTTWHTGHGSIESLYNHSQQLVPSRIDIPAAVWDELDETTVGSTVNAASHDFGLTNVLLTQDIEAKNEQDGVATVTVRASRPLSRRQRGIIADRITDRVSERRRG